jgi:hypothetical protein
MKPDIWKSGPLEKRREVPLSKVSEIHQGASLCGENDTLIGVDYVPHST